MSSLFTFLTEQLRQPNWWAVAISLGIHGMLGTSDPVLSVFSPPIKHHQKVGLVELTPSEIRRLPQLLPPQISPPKFAIPPIPLPPDPSAIQFPSLPPGKLSLLPPRPSLPPLNFQPPSQYIPPTPPPNKPLVMVTPPPLPSPSPTLTPPPLNGENLPSLPPVRNDPQNEEEREKMRNADPRRPNFDPVKIFTPEDFPQGVPTTDPNQKTPVNPTPTPTPTTTTTPTPTPTTSPSPSRDDPTKRNRLNKSPLVTAMEKKMEEERLKIQQQKEQNGGGNSNYLSKSNKNNLVFVDIYSAMFERFKGAHRGLETANIIRKSTVYPKEACPKKLEDKVVYGVVVKPEGAIAAAPELLVSEGYDVLNLAAKNAINDHKFPTSNVPKLYPLVFEFKYDEKVCITQPSTSPSPSTEPSTRPSPSTDPSNQPLQ